MMMAVVGIIKSFLKKVWDQSASVELKRGEPREVLSSEVLAKIRRLQLKAGWKVTDSFLGKYSSAFRGSGMEFEKLREYVVGDDIRSIDWKVSARMRRAYVREYREERQMSVILMVDVSRSMNWGSSLKTKKDIVLELVSILGFICNKNNDRVGLILFSDKVDKFIPLGKGSAHVWNLIKSTLFSKSEGRSSSLEEALLFLRRTVKRKATVFIVSDFLNNDGSTLLSHLARFHDCTCVRVHDRLEDSMFDVGVVDIEDIETGKKIHLDSKTVYKTYIREETKRVEEFENYLKRNKIGYLPLSSDCTDIVKELELYIKKKTALGRR